MRWVRPEGVFALLMGVSPPDHGASAVMHICVGTAVELRMG